jgi:hypothetical protein
MKHIELVIDEKMNTRIKLALTMKEQIVQSDLNVT